LYEGKRWFQRAEKGRRAGEIGLLGEREGERISKERDCLGSRLRGRKTIKRGLVRKEENHSDQ